MEISAGLSAFESKDDLCEWDADEIEEIAESIEEVRGMPRGTGRPARVGTIVCVGELGGDPDACVGAARSEAFRDGSREGICAIFSLSPCSSTVPIRSVGAAAVAIDDTDELCRSLVGGTGNPEVDAGEMGESHSDAKVFRPNAGDRGLAVADSRL